MCVQLEQSCCRFKAHLLLCWQETPPWKSLFSLPYTLPPLTLWAGQIARDRSCTHIAMGPLLLWQGLSQIPFHILASPEILVFYSRCLQKSHLATSCQRSSMDSTRSVQRFYLTVIKGEADDDSKPVNLGLGLTDNTHQIKLTKNSLGAGQGELEAKT